MDKTLSDLIKQEEVRQDETLMMIPSENYTSQAVREALGSVLTNKYAEGYPGKRYYQGNKIVDEIENLTIERAKKVFNVKFANVQPYSGSPANLAIYLALCQPNDVVMGMALSSGGHLTHGHKVNFSGKLFQSVQYEVGKDGFIDYEAVEKLVKDCRPKIIWAGGTAYPRFFDWEKFRKIADNVGAYLAADISHYAGLVIAGIYPSPAGIADVIMTTTHKTLRGPRGAIIMTDNEELAKKIDRAVFPGLQGGPHENAIAGIAQALFEADTLEFK
ncbi:MAG: serine hydroxymethyltransferase, partial [bacterium]|nr:serine hydroxymethyltransferase [bacterium]